jgi:hypothetical protein
MNATKDIYAHGERVKSSNYLANFKILCKNKKKNALRIILTASSLPFFPFTLGVLHHLALSYTLQINSN